MYPIVRSFVQPLKQTEMIDLEVQIRLRWQNWMLPLDKEIRDSRWDIEVYAGFPYMPWVPDDIWVDESVADPEEPEGCMPEADTWTTEVDVQYIIAETLMMKGGSIQSDVVKQWKSVDDGHSTEETWHPLFNTREYGKVFVDQSMDVLSVNVIA